MILKLLKDYGNHKAGDKIAVGATRAQVLIDSRIAEDADGKVQAKEEKKAVVTKELKSPIKTKVKTKN